MSVYIITLNPSGFPARTGPLLRAPFVELWPSVPGAKASVPGPAICPGRSFPKLLGAFRRLGRLSRLPGEALRIFSESLPGV